MSENLTRRIGIVGSRKFTNRARVEMWFSMFIRQVGKENIVIVSGACPDGADSLAKTVALAWQMEYRHFPPSHRKWDKWCILGPENYGKPYKPANFFERNTLIAEYCDPVVTFVVPGVASHGSMDTITKARNLGKATWVDNGEIIQFDTSNV